MGPDAFYLELESPGGRPSTSTKGYLELAWLVYLLFGSGQSQTAFLFFIRSLL